MSLPTRASVPPPTPLKRPSTGRTPPRPARSLPRRPHSLPPHKINTPANLTNLTDAYPPASLKFITEGSFFRVFKTPSGTALRISKRRCDGRPEASLLTLLRSPYINRLIRFWEEDGHPHFEMELCPGGSLQDRIFKRNTGQRLHATTAATAETPAYPPENDKPSLNQMEASAPPATTRLTAGIPENSALQRPAHPPGVLCDSHTTTFGYATHLQPKLGLPLFSPRSSSSDSPSTDSFSAELSRINSSVVYTAESEPEEAPFVPTAFKHPKWLIQLMRSVAASLAHIHAAGIIHMDVKPANILVRGRRFILCDFNIARQGEGEIDLDGDPLYMAPEILKNRCYFVSDVFSLGMIYLELCNPGRVLPRSGVAYAALRRNDFTGWALDEIGRRMLEAAPRNRATAGEVHAYFEKLSQG